MRTSKVFEAAVEYADNPESWRAGKDEIGASGLGATADTVRVRSGQRLDSFDGEL
jgi:hypothetical protein